MMERLGVWRHQDKAAAVTGPALPAQPVVTTALCLFRLSQGPASCHARPSHLLRILEMVELGARFDVAAPCLGLLFRGSEPSVPYLCHAKLCGPVPDGDLERPI